MAVNFSDNFKTGAPKPTDDRYFDWTNSLIPWASTSAVNTAIPASRRHVGLTVNIGGEEYWYKDGILDIDLIPKDNSTDATATYDKVWMSGTTEGITLDYWYDKTQSAGRFSGGTITVGTPGTVNVAAGAGLIKDGTGDTAQNRYVTWGATSVNLLNGYNYIYYDAELHIVTGTTAEAEIERNDNFNLGRVFYDVSNNLTIARLCGQNLWNLNRRIHLYGDQVYGVQRASGLITTSVSGLTIQVSGGVLWAEVLNKFTTENFDSRTDDFREWYRDSGNWSGVVKSTGNLNNSNYNLNSNTNSSLTAGYYTIRWVYVVHDGSIHVVYDTNQYSGLTQAQLASPPAALPPVVSGYATLSARVIVQEGNPNIIEVDSAYEQVFVTQSVATHNDLGGIQGGQAGEYNHLTNAQIVGVNDIANKLDTIVFTGYTASTNTRFNTIEGQYVTGVTNGLTKYDSHNVCLGGNLTQTTAIDAGTNNFEIYGNIGGGELQRTDTCISLLAGNSSLRVVDNSLSFNNGAGVNMSFSNTNAVVSNTGGTGIVYGNDYESTLVDRSLITKQYVDDLVAESGVTASNGLNVDGVDVKLGGALTETTTIYGSQTLNVNVTDANLTGSTGVNLTGEVRLKTTPATYNGDVLTFDPSDGSISKTTLSSLGGLTGATNGLETSGQDVVLGGALTKDTTIGGAGFDLSLGTDASKLDVLEVNTSGNIDVASDANLVMSLSGGTITTSDNKGLRYTSDYTDTFVDSSLVSKLYVDTIATGLDPKSAVLVATTTDITLSGTQTIDGVALVAGDRVLVKNQSTGADNGIYVVTGGTWSRALDFDGNPTGEVTEGALIPVLSGNTQINSSWILITKNPIVVGTTALVFTKFSQLLDVSAGDGIRIDTAGQTKEINVELASASGLKFVSGDLSINVIPASGLELSLTTGLNVATTIAGNALDYTNGVIDVNIVDINSQLGGVLTGITNGLSETTTGVVELGGDLTKATTITSGEATSLTFVDSHTTAKQGIVYGGDYSGSYVARSLVDAAYVTGLTSTIDGDITGLDARLDVIEPIYVTGATNGLSKDGAHLVKLGGELTEITVINATGTTLQLIGSTGDGYGNRGIELGGGTIQIGNFTDFTTLIQVGSETIDLSAFDISGSCIDSIRLDPATGILLTHNSPAITSCIGFNDLGVFIVSPSGATYGDDYSTNYTARSLVDAAYVDHQISASAVTFTNGLTNTGGYVCLGGMLSEDTNIVLDSYDINIGSISALDYTYIRTFYNAGNQSFVEIGACSSASDDRTTLLVRNDKIEIDTECTSTFCGIAYRNGFTSAVGNKTGSSIPDIDWVTGQTSTSGVQTANNGLTKTGTNVVLGGALNAITTINGGQTLNIVNALNVTGATNITGTVDMSSTLNVVGAIDTNSTLDVLGATSLRNTLDVTGATTMTSLTASGAIIGASTLNISGATHLDDTLRVDGAATLNSVAAGSITDSVLTITSAGEIQKVSGSALGDRNNIYAMEIITTDVTLTTGSTYVQLVNAPSATSIIITLPATPLNGQVFRIKDAAGAALSYAITVDGNGNEIDNALTPALLNTDGGALELVWNQALSSWYVFSFVN